MVTYKKISDVARVSESTVSKALSGSSEISFETVNKIRSIACELGYYRDKRSLRRRYSRDFKPHIAIICPELISSYYMAVAESLINAIVADGGRATVMISRFAHDERLSLAESVACNPDFDGIILTHSIHSAKKLNIPMVFILSQNVIEDADSLFYNPCDEIEKIVKYLTDTGHRSIGFGGEQLTASKERCFRESLKKLDIPVSEEYIFCSNKRFYEAGRECFEEFKRRGDTSPDAMVFAYDEIAAGFMSEAEKHGLKIPEDISVVGMNDIEFCAYTSPALTSVSCWSSQMAEKAYELLKSRILNPQTPFRSISCESVLAERESVKKRK